MSEFESVLWTKKPESHCPKHATEHSVPRWHNYVQYWVERSSTWPLTVGFLRAFNALMNKYGDFPEQVRMLPLVIYLSHREKSSQEHMWGLVFLRKHFGGSFSRRTSPSLWAMFKGCLYKGLIQRQTPPSSLVPNPETHLATSLYLRHFLNVFEKIQKITHSPWDGDGATSQSKKESWYLIYSTLGLEHLLGTCFLS